MKKLIGVERSVNVYRKSDNEKENEFLLHTSFEKIATIVLPSETDPLLYDGYVLTEIQTNNFNAILEEKIDLNFNKYFYVLECSGIYE